MNADTDWVEERKIHVLSQHSSPSFSSCSVLFQGRGRGVISTGFIPRGSVILFESRPLVAVVHARRSLEACANCFGLRLGEVSTKFNKQVNATHTEDKRRREKEEIGVGVSVCVRNSNLMTHFSSIGRRIFVFFSSARGLFDLLPSCLVQ